MGIFHCRVRLQECYSSCYYKCCKIHPKCWRVFIHPHHQLSCRFWILAAPRPPRMAEKAGDGAWKLAQDIHQSHGFVFGVMKDVITISLHPESLIYRSWTFYCPKRKGSSFNQPFSGAILNFRGIYTGIYIDVKLYELMGKRFSSLEYHSYCVERTRPFCFTFRNFFGGLFKQYFKQKTAPK